MKSLKKHEIVELVAFLSSGDISSSADWIRSRGGFDSVLHQLGALLVSSDSLPLIRALSNTGSIQPRGVTGTQVWNIVRRRTEDAGLAVSPHDLRRSHARLSHDGGASMEEIQQGLGHSSVVTTERYVNAQVRLEKGAGDYIRL